MRSRLLMFRRVLPPEGPLSSQSKALSLRTFAQSTAVRVRTRPQVPFLSVPNTTRTHRVRYLTTERKARLKYEIKLGIKVITYIWLAVGCLFAGAFAIEQELLERQFPTPHEWSFLSRFRFRGAHCERDQTDPSRSNDWLAIMQWIKGLVERLEDPAVDGAGLKDAPHDLPRGTKDISAMSEPWRRGYYEAMMLYAKAAERMDGWVLDKPRNLIFPPEMVVGPSNPKPRPIPPGYKGAPKEQDCEVAFESPDDIYLRILSTEGLTNRQKMDAGLAYASWLDFKGITGPASIIYEDAVDLAASDLPAQSLDRKSWTLNDAAGAPSQNLLTSLTAYATFRARHDDLSSALPMLVSILKARRSLPAQDPKYSSLLSYSGPAKPSGNFISNIPSAIVGFISPPAYPPPPDNGTAPPFRDTKELCEEAALSLHIGEIIYASPGGSREEGLSWTREAVDEAEEQLHKLTTRTVDRDARLTCRDCLSAGLQNWSVMVEKLARDEAAKAVQKDMQESAGQQAGGGGGVRWFGRLWGEGTAKKEDLSRWAAEKKVIVERERRAKELLDDLEPPANGLSSIFTA
ncbi:hypothetical protein B0T17DRAFT_522069 [Bombardia bombarda]|uniref:MFS maltose permease n=1 Tax=Bombardia bombarda TaxID=252184 RepID=A0AA39X6I5_9PEZI|nr:hypothetical protein B0T17DRAFT_522069 [Bombardia bombarda]